MKIFSVRQLVRRGLWLLACAVLLIPALVLFNSSKASAASLIYSQVRFNRMDASQATTGTVCAKTTAAAVTEAAVAVTFPTGYTVSGTFGNWAVNTTNSPATWPLDPTDDTTTATAWTGITAPSNANQISGQTVQFTSSNLTASTWYCFNWTNTAALTIKSSATNNNTGVITTCTNSTDCAGTGSGGGTTGNADTDNWATASVGASCGTVACDQIGVTGSVAPNFSFSLSANSTALGTITTSGVSSPTPINATVSTNGYKGWTMWAADPAGTPGLNSTIASKNIPYAPTVGSAAAVLATQEGYNLGVAAAAGTTCNGATPNANFASSGTGLKGGGLDNTLRIIGVSTGIANACYFPLTVNAMILATTPAASDYAGTMTIVAAGRF